MAKKDNVDETPIEFYIPPSGSGLRRMGPRVPIPINQPHWKYKSYSNSHASQSAIARVCFVIAIAISILLIVARLYKSPLWIAVIVFGLAAFISARSAHPKSLSHTEEMDKDENIVSPRKRKKKLPKHRKDYK